MSRPLDPFGVFLPLCLKKGEVFCYSLRALEKTWPGLHAYPKTIKVLLEAALRNFDNYTIRTADIEAIANWGSSAKLRVEVPLKPARVVLQDFTGVPAIVDLAALREACTVLGGDASRINPLVACDLVIDHSVQVDYFGAPDAFENNLKMEFERNRERYEFLKWGEKAFSNFHVVPPGTGIVHQVNLEYFSDVVHLENGVAYPDSLVGTDSHTTMINALGVLGWGVGGIEAEAVMLGQPVYMLLPDVVGVRLSGALSEGVCATDLVLTLTSNLRREGVVGSFVEFFGPGLSSLSLPDRATVANMAPEYGATTGFFPVDEETLDYLALSGREDRCDLVEIYCRQQGLWHEVAETPCFSRVIELDMSTVRPSLAGPKRPQDRIDLSAMSRQWMRDLSTVFDKPAMLEADEMASEGCVKVESRPHPGRESIDITMHSQRVSLRHGAVVIAAITSCTNTSNPEVLIAAALLARAARKRGLHPQPWVKTSFAPGSRVVIDYLASAGLMDDLGALGFSNVAFGCTTCIGNSGPLPDPVAQAVRAGDLVVAGVLSGNRNFEGRINPLVKANYLASPALVIAYALAGTVAIDFEHEPIGNDGDGRAVFLRELYPSDEEVREVARSVVLPEYFKSRYAEVHEGPELWRALKTAGDAFYQWDPDSTYIRRPPFFDGIVPNPEGVAPIRRARCLALFGDSVTTDHISPAGMIQPGQPAGIYLLSTGVSEKDFNTFGSRRGNHEVMVRGTFDNIRIRNKLAPGTEGGYTSRFRSESDADGEVGTLYDSAMHYKEAGVPLVVIAGEDYGMGSSRDWAAKGTAMLGVRAVIAVSFERIHRSNLIGMGVLPLQFDDGQDAASLGLSGREIFDIAIDDALNPGDRIEVVATDPKTAKMIPFTLRCRIDTPVEVEYFRNGGILQTVVRRIASEGR
jgi:aconitate hydratase